ncbi:Uncharacterised protein [Mycobacteroides abscessus subsp. abscessus]|nr:Uncharacterised protein [Mycobacteroides abscessus subsp. abscessus]
MLEIALPALIIALATHPTTRALLGEGAGRVRNEGEALRRRAAERASRVGAAASTMDEAWAEASDPEMPEDTSEAAAEDAADSEAGRAEGDEEDPETKATRREGLN